MKVLTAEQMREVDRLTTERYGIPGLQLMENAATSVVNETLKTYGPLGKKRVLVISGRGNNGGDGAAVARLLHEKGADIHLILLGRIEDAEGDARTNFDRARNLSASYAETFELSEVSTIEEFDRQIRDRNYDLYFDAIFGTGLTRPAEGLHQHAIQFLNANGTANGYRWNEAPLIVAVDIPSGIASDTSELVGPAVHA
ncbi:MAG: NAD(P)H-hydrate epimerase, partial [Blastocatellia bacterium]